MITPTSLIDRNIDRIRNDLLNCERNPELKAEHEAELSGWIALKAMVEECAAIAAAERQACVQAVADLQSRLQDKMKVRGLKALPRLHTQVQVLGDAIAAIRALPSAPLSMEKPHG